MRKSILMLINGFGIERKDSAEIYSATLMPNMDFMTKNFLFGSLATLAGDSNNGYRLFSMPTKNKKSKDIIDDMIYEGSLSKNEMLLSIASTLTDQNKLHIFYILNSDSKLHQVREMLKVINPQKNKRVFLHIIMTGTSVDDYNDILKIVAKLSFETADYAKIGLIVGKNKINTDDTLRTFYKEYGEYWNESTKKFDILKRDVVNPEDCTVFYVNKGFSFHENDTILILNFEDVDMNKFYDDFTRVSCQKYSLYEFKDGVTNIFKKEKEDIVSFASNLETFGIKLLVFTEQSRINEINFYLNGMQKKLSPNISYAINDLQLFSSKENVINTIENSNCDGFIIEFDIGLLNKMSDIKEVLSKIDSIIKPISDASLERGYTFIISSLYGMHASVNDGVVPKIINFSQKVPILFQNNEFVRGEYLLNSGDTYLLAETFLTSINDDVKANRLVHKKSKLEQILSRK